MAWFKRLTNILRPAKVRGEIEEELHYHINARTADNVARGMSPAEARADAARRFGGTTVALDRSYEANVFIWLETILQDLRFGLRMIVKYRTASCAAIVSLALAMGSCSAAFTLIDALIFRPLPVSDPSQLFDLARVMPAFLSPGNQPRESDSFSYPQYELLRDTARAGADIFAMNLSGGLQRALFDDSLDASETIRVESISGRGFEILGVTAALGRLIQPKDDSIASPPVAVLSYAFWKRHFGAGPSAIGRHVIIGAKHFQIIGIAAPPFGGVQPGYLTDIWLPLSVAADSRILADPDRGNFKLWGRFHQLTGRSELRERLQAVLTNFLRDRVRINPPRNLSGEQLQQLTDTPLRIRDASSGTDSLFRLQFRRPLWILCLICTLLLLIASSNVANLMLARASARDSEMALRISLGAGRSRLIRQMLVESMLLAAAASVLAVAFAAFIAPAIVARLGPTEFPASLNVAPGSRTLLFAATLSLITALLFGIVPALRGFSTSPGTALKSGGTRHPGSIGSLRWMLSAEIGFSVAVLFISGLLLLSFRKLTAVDLGFTSENVALFDLAPRQPEDHRRSSGAELLEHLRRLPGVQAASLSQQRPMGGDMAWVMTPVIRLAGQPNETVRPREVPVSAGFFQAMQIRRIAGRDFLPEEIASNSQSVIVNQAFVDKFLPGQDPIGQQFEKMGDDPDPVRQQIIGVVGNARYNNLREPERPSIYTPLRNLAGATLNIRATSRIASLVPWLRKEIEASAPNLMVRGSILLQTQIDNTMISERLLAILGAFFSIVALLLAGLGLYGVINYSAVRRTHEMGIRIALGARRAAVVGLVVSDTFMIVTVGVGLGIAGGIAMARYLASQLFGVKPTDFWSLAAPVVCILLVAVAAVFPPALRAASADPLIALRHE